MQFRRRKMTKEEQKAKLLELEETMELLDDARRELQYQAFYIMQFNAPLARSLVDITNALMVIDAKYNSTMSRIA